MLVGLFRFVLAASLCGWALINVSQPAPILPPVASGALVAHFKADADSVAVDASNIVVSWTAENDAAVVLSAAGTNHPANIRFDATGMNGEPTIVVNDFVGGNRYLRGALRGTRTASTLFWLGYYSPGRGGSLGDAQGQYVYSYGADGVEGSQLDHQIDTSRFELFGGFGTQAGDDISAFNSQYTVWRTLYGTGAGNGHEAAANETNLNVPSPNGANYNVSGQLVLFGFQTTPGASGGFNFVGNISELILYDGILSTADIGSVECYLRKRKATMGDFDLDGDVDRGDAAILAARYAGSPSAVGCHGELDLDGDGTINLTDMAIFQSRLGSPLAPAPIATAVPEPSTAVLLVVGIAGWLATCRRSRRAMLRARRSLRLRSGPGSVRRW